MPSAVAVSSVPNATAVESGPVAVQVSPDPGVEKSRDPTATQAPTTALACAGEPTAPTANAPEARVPTVTPASRERSRDAVGTALCLPTWTALC